MNTTESTTIEPYLPAGLAADSRPGPIERFLTKPFRQQAEIWLSQD